MQGLWLQVFLDKPINKFFLKAETCTLKPSRTELWVCPKSRGSHKIKMVSIYCECGLLVKSLLKQLRISTLELKIN